MASERDEREHHLDVAREVPDEDRLGRERPAARVRADVTEDVGELQGGAEVDGPAHTAPSARAKSCAAASPGRVNA